MLLAVVVGVGLWLFWPDANKLTRHSLRGDISGVRRCLAFGVDPNEPSRYGYKLHATGQTPLTAAAQGAHNEVIEILIEYGADPNLRDSGPEYPHETPCLLYTSPSPRDRG